MVRLTYQASEPPTPTTEIGEQVIPMGAVTSWTTTPMDARSDAAAGLLAVCTDWQHWMEPVLPEHEVPSAGAGAGVAAARIESVEKARSLANIAVAGER